MLNEVYRENLDFRDIDLVKKKIELNKNYNQKQRKILNLYAKLANLNKKSIVLEIGCQFALFHNIHPNYIGIDINPRLIEFAKKIHNKKINLLVADATKIPIKKKIDFIFSFATIEHIKRPDLVFGEIDKILNKNGILFLAPAWNCRKYTVQKLQFRKYSELSIPLKISKLLIPLQNNLIFRGLIKLPFRIYDEILHLLKKK